MSLEKPWGKMKIRYKFALIIAVFSGVIVLLLSIGFDILSHITIKNNEIQKVENLAKELALHVESHLKEKTFIAITLSSAPIIKTALMESNAEFDALSDQEQAQEIDRRNQQWMATTKTSDPFIQSHMTGKLAEYLKLQKEILPGEYGEVFLTNRYGVMIATTDKLTTLAHAQKYWWLAANDEGRGKIFLDDRGFDSSVQGYVVGVVIPIRSENEIIGILKCNVNILGPLTDIIKDFDRRNPSNMRISRTGGRIVCESGAEPLSSQVGVTLVELIGRNVTGSTTIAENGIYQLVAFSPVPISIAAEAIGFGGSESSIDQSLGNKGEGWHVLISLDEKIITQAARKNTIIAIICGAIFTILAVIVSLFVGNWATRSIVKLSNIAELIGEGHLDTRSEIRSKDEIGSLAESLNQMVTNLQETMTSRDNLVFEINQRKKAEADKEKVIGDLERALNEIKTLEGILPICSSCKKIRDDQGNWKQIESYIHKHSKAEFSHGICPDCAKKLYPDLDI